ncbi:MAG: hypothetical protein ACRDZ7_10720 [Acidimicrobiia bacterium]
MLCCLVGGVLVAAIARSAARNPHRRQSLPAALLLGAGAGILSVEVFLATLVPFGWADAPGSLLARLVLIVVSAAFAAFGVAAGGPSALLSARGTAFLGLAAGASALLTEGVDIHLLHLNDPAGTLSTLLVHLVPISFLCAGLWRAARLAGIESTRSCRCPDPCPCCGPDSGSRVEPAQLLVDD